MKIVMGFYQVPYFILMAERVILKFTSCLFPKQTQRVATV